MLSPMINRVFGILARSNKLPPPPELLSGVDYNVEYVSPLARAQRQVEANGLLRVFEIGSSVFQVDPSAAAVLRGPDTIRWLGDLFGVPTSLFKSEEEVAELFAKQQQQQEMQQQLEAADTGAGAVQKLMGAVNGGQAQ